MNPEGPVPPADDQPAPATPAAGARSPAEGTGTTAPSPPVEVPLSVRALLARFGLRPKKRLGQNFLVDQRILRRIVEAADLQPTDTVVEVGPGLGLLTRELARRAGRVVAVEIDPQMAAVLRDVLADLPNVEIVVQDILRFDHVAYLGGQPYKVVANLPYYITSAALRHFLEARVRPRLMVVMVQKEVAQRILAGPGALSLLAISVQCYGRPRLVCWVPRTAFYPPPRVDSAVLRIEVFERPAVAVDPARFFRVVAAGFAHPRKQLHNSLERALGLSHALVDAALVAAGIAPQRRAETLSLEEWARLTRELEHRGLLPDGTRPTPADRSGQTEPDA